MKIMVAGVSRVENGKCGSIPICMQLIWFDIYVLMARIHLFVRPQVPGAIAGPMLGEAAHRLVKNTLNIRTNNIGFFGAAPQRNYPGNYGSNRPRPAGPSGYERGIDVDYQYYGYQNNIRGIAANSRSPVMLNGMQGYKQNIRIQEKSQYPEQYRNLKQGMSALTMEESVRVRPSAMMSPQMPGSGQSTPTEKEQNMCGPPPPPTKWIKKSGSADGGMEIDRDQSLLGGLNQRQVKKVYQVKS